ncbi:MAG: translation elongation factor Ts [Candidatus Omnitrophica bacterium]|nr:translation elongation factor Ts [Candidatus Omnitrophota bacterium]
MDQIEAVKELRFKTSAGMVECREALKESGWDIEKAVDILRKKGAAKAAKKASRSAGEGLVEAYIHTGGKIGVLIEVNCETDFVARNEDFKVFARDLAMQVAAVNPIYVSRENVPAADIEREKEVYRSQITGKPENVVEKILDGKLEKYFQDVCLLDQSFVKDPDKRIKDILAELVSKIGENIVVRRFTRYALGEMSK